MVVARLWLPVNCEPLKEPSGPSTELGPGRSTRLEGQQGLEEVDRCAWGYEGTGNQHLGPEGQISCELFLGVPWGC